MPDLKIERALDAPIERVFAYMTEPENLLKWWGPQGMSIAENALDLSRNGAWFSVMQNAEGQRYKVSGEVLQVQPHERVVFTWGWHDENDKRGEETEVEFVLRAIDENKTQLTLNHRGFAHEDGVSNHNQGWTSSLIKLEEWASGSNQ